MQEKCVFITLSWHGLMLMLKYYRFITTLIYLIIIVVKQNYLVGRKHWMLFYRIITSVEREEWYMYVTGKIV